MRFIAIRHGKTINNALHEKNYEEYLKNRNQDPDLCEGGKEQCEFIGNFLSQIFFDNLNSFVSKFIKQLFC